MTSKRVVRKKCAVLIMGTLTVMLPMTLGALYADDCKERLMDAFTRACGTARSKRGIEKLELRKAEKLELVEPSSELSFESEEVPVSLNILDKRDVASNTTESSVNPLGKDHDLEVTPAPKKNKRRSASISSYGGASAETHMLGFEMTDEEMLELYTDLNDRLPRSYTQAEWKKILLDLSKACCYEGSTCDSESLNIPCF